MSTLVRRQRVASQIRRILMGEFAKIAIDEKSFFGVNISYIKMSNDLSYAKIYINGSDELVDKLSEDKRHYRSIVAKSISMRYVPEIIFLKDTFTEQAYKVDRLIDKIKEERSAEEYDLKEREVAELLRDAKNILIVSHINPDGDNVGSTLGLSNSLKQMGKTVVVANRSGIPDNFMFLKGADKVISTQRLRPEFDVIVFADCGSVERAALEPDILNSKARIVNIDHHITNNRYGTYNLIDEDAPSASFVVFNLLKHNGFPIDETVAEPLYAALLTDTGSFRYSSTSSAAFKMAAEMIDLGVDPWYVASNIYENKKPSQLKLLGRLLSNIEYFFDNRLALIVLRKEDFEATGTTVADSEGIVNYARAIKGVEIGALIREEDEGICKISLRSKNLDISSVALSFGGGGHKNASGFSLSGTPEKVKADLISEIGKLFD